MSNPRRSPDITLPRGKACLSCRRRKMRCDGARPVCTQCIRGNREDDCEYTDNQGRTRTQMLEENVARLQARIQELENPNTGGSSILLHDPYSSVRRAAAGGSSAGVTQPAQTLSAPYMRVPSMSGTSASQGALGSRLDTPLRPDSTPAVMPWWEFEEPPTQVAQWLVQQVMPHSRQLNFALSIPRFVSSLSLPTLHPARPHPALLHTIYLWALHLSKTDDLMQHEGLYLQRAILSLQDALGGGSAALVQTNGYAAMRRIHAIQAEVLLAEYFYTLGRFLEGQYHANAAVSLALSSGLHRIHPRSASATGSNISDTALVPRGGNTGLFDLSPPQDAIELGERINVFWAVFTIDKSWAAAMNVPSLIGDSNSSSSTSQQARIDTPWPLDTEEYEVFHGILDKAQTTPNSPPPVQPSSRTVQDFLAGQPTREGQANESSYTALRAKASVLFERATRLGATYVSSGSHPAQETVDEMQSLSRIVTRFARGLHPLDDLETRVSSRDARQSMLVVHSLAHAAMIQIHHARAYAGVEPDMEAINVTLVHAGEIVRILEIIGDAQGGQLDPILGFIWMLAAQIFAEELNRVRRLAPTPALASRVNALQINLNRISTALGPLSANPVVAFQIAKINELLRE